MHRNFKDKNGNIITLINKKEPKGNKEINNFITIARYAITKMQDLGNASLECEDIGVLKKLKVSIEKLLKEH